MTRKKRGLGKGLAALIPDESIDSRSIANIELSLIEPNKNQPRQEFNKEALKELTESIKEYGVIQPIIVRKKGKKYEIVAGERRWKASTLAQLDKIPSIVKEIDDKDVMKIALIENIQRENLNPVEEAQAFKGLMEDYELTQEEVGRAIGKSRSYIANTVRLLNLDEETKVYISKGKISSGHGRALLGIENKEERKEAVKLIVDNKINVRKTEDMVKRTKDNKNNKKKKPTITRKDPFIIEIEENLMRALGTKVKLSQKEKGGKIEIEFYGDEDLERLIDLIT